MNPLDIVPERFTVAEAPGEGVLGFAQMVPVGSPSSPAQWEFRSLVVRRKYRGRGIGRALLRTALSAASPGDEVFATTIGSRVTFYMEEGFQELRWRDMPGFLLVEWLLGNVVTRVGFQDRCAALRKII